MDGERKSNDLEPDDRRTGTICNRCGIRCGRSSSKTFWALALRVRRTLCTTLLCYEGRGRATGARSRILIWRWQHPAAFLVRCLAWGYSCRGTLVLYPIARRQCWHTGPQRSLLSTRRLLCRLGAWAASARALPQMKSRWISATVATDGIGDPRYANIRFYFFRYYADPGELKE